MHSVALNQRLIFFFHFFPMLFGFVCERLSRRDAHYFAFSISKAIEVIRLSAIICQDSAILPRHSWRDALMPSLRCCRTVVLQLRLGRLLNIVNVISLCLSRRYLTTLRWIVSTIMVRGSATFSDVDADNYRSFLLAPSGREQYWSLLFKLQDWPSWSQIPCLKNSNWRLNCPCNLAWPSAPGFYILVTPEQLCVQLHLSWRRCLYLETITFQ